jgi:hypothetical protein
VCDSVLIGSWVFFSLHFNCSSCIVQFLSLCGSCSVSVFSSVSVIRNMMTTFTMDFILHPCYSWYIRPHYQWMLSYNPATAGTTDHMTNGLYSTPLLQLVHQATLQMDVIIYPCYSWYNRPHYQLSQTYTPATADKRDWSTKGLTAKPIYLQCEKTTSQCNKGLALTPTTPIAGTTVLRSKWLSLIPSCR